MLLHILLVLLQPRLLHLGELDRNLRITPPLRLFLRCLEYRYVQEPYRQVRRLLQLLLQRVLGGRELGATA